MHILGFCILLIPFIGYISYYIAEINMIGNMNLLHQKLKAWEAI